VDAIASIWVAPQEYRLVPWKKFREIGRFFVCNKEDTVCWIFDGAEVKTKRELKYDNNEMRKGDIEDENIP
jgi:hypothetical protein